MYGFYYLLLSLIVNIVAANLEDVPVVYVAFGGLQSYAQLVFELARTNNRVVVIRNSGFQRKFHNIELNTKETKGVMENQSLHYDRPEQGKGGAVEYVSMGNYFASAHSFEQVYRHMCPDLSPKRAKHELQNFQRFFVLREYMELTRTSRVFYADGDSAVFVNMTQRVNSMDSVRNCDAIINIPLNGDKHLWVAAAEASVFSQKSIVDLTDFMMTMYSKAEYRAVLQKRRNVSGRCNVDMNLMWLWFVSRSVGGGDKGTPATPVVIQTDGKLKDSMENLKRAHDKSFEHAASLHLPFPTNDTDSSQASKGNQVVICNGMDSVSGYAFDHMHAWVQGRDFRFFFNKKGGASPQISGEALFNGGKPFTPSNTEEPHSGSGSERHDKDTIKTQKMVNEKSVDATPSVKLATLHYQGDAKRFLYFDVCRALVGSRRSVTSLKDQSIRELCERAIQAGGGYDNCSKRPVAGGKHFICI